MPRPARPKPPGPWGELEDLMRTGNWTLTDLATASGVSLSLLSELRAGRKSPAEWAIHALAAAMHIRPETLRPVYLLPADVPHPARPADDTAEMPVVEPADALPA